MSTFWVQFILILGPVLVVPLALSGERLIRSLPQRRTIGLLAAALLSIAHLVTPGRLAGLLSTGWLIYTFYLMAEAYYGWRSHGKVFTLDWLLTLATYLFLFTGALWATAERLAWQPFGFDPLIVLLTAVHFHYAGFALTWAGKNIVAGALSSLKKYFVAGLLAGIPLTALGITGTHWKWTPLIEVIGVLITVSAGMTIGLSHLAMSLKNKAALKIRILWALAGTALIFGMGLALMYGLRFYWPIPGLTIPWMYTIHGSLNSFGFAIPALLAWHWHHKEQAVNSAFPNRRSGLRKQ